MNIVVLDGGTTNPGDLSWAPLERLGQVTVYSQTPQPLVVERLATAQAALLNRAALGREEFAQLPQLRYVGTLATGYNTIDVAAAREAGVTVCNVPHYCEDAVAQHALALLLCLCNKVQRSSQAVRAGHWAQAVEESHQSLSPHRPGGEAPGGVGLRQHGAAHGRPGPGFGHGSPPVQQDAKGRAGRLPLGGCGNPFSGKAMWCPSTAPSMGKPGGWWGRRLLALLKPTALLINTARGGLVDESALAEALNQGKLAGAGLDVLTQEPPPPSCPLLTARNCVITPHVAWAAQEVRARLIDEVAENLRCFLAGHPRNVVS